MRESWKYFQFLNSTDKDFFFPMLMKWFYNIIFFKKKSFKTLPSVVLQAKRK